MYDKTHYNKKKKVCWEWQVENEYGRFVLAPSNLNVNQNAWRTVSLHHPQGKKSKVKKLIYFKRKRDALITPKKMISGV